MGQTSRLAPACSLTAIGLGILLAFAANEARSQAAGSTVVSSTSAAGSRVGIEEVVVTARRKEEKQQDVPLAVTVLGEDFLEKNAISNIMDLNGKVPALRIESFNSPSYTNVGIRAQRTANVAPGQDSAVGYYFNEVNYSFPVGIAQQMFDLQSAEIVKGPQGTLFGRNTTGGALLLRSNRPTDTLEGSIKLGMTHFDHGNGFSTTAVLNLPVNEALQLRGAFNVIDRDGYVRNEISSSDLANYNNWAPFRGNGGGRNQNDEDSRAWRLSALLKAGPDVESLFVYQGSRLKTNGTAYSLLALNPAGTAAFAIGLGGGDAVAAFERRRKRQQSDFWTTESGFSTKNYLSTHDFSNVTTVRLNDNITFKNIISYRRFDLDDNLDLASLPYPVLDVNIKDEGDEWSEEFQVQGRTDDDSINWVAGVFFSGQKIDHYSDQQAVPQFGGVPSKHLEQIDNTSKAIFAQGTFRMPSFDRLSLTVGARVTEDHRRMERQAYSNRQGTACSLRDADNLPAFLPIGQCNLSGNRKFREPTYNISLDYKIDDQTLIYLAHRKGYRSGGFDYTGPHADAFTFDPEFVKDVEIGLKKDWFIGNATLRTNLAVYQQKYEGIQRFSSPKDEPSNFSVINAADATIDGAELELTLVPFPDLELSAFYSYIDAGYDNFVTGAGDFTRNEFAQVPKNQYSLRARYTLPLDETIGTVTLQADYTHQSRIFWTDTAQGPVHGPAKSQGQDGYGILNLRADWASIMQSPFDLAFYIKNVNETKYNMFGINLYQAFGYTIGSIGQPRIFGLEGTYRF